MPAHNRSGTIADVEHVVFLMQENRSFDHYFGTLRGVRGFADPHPVTLPSGRSVWHQPNGSAELLRFRPEVRDLGQATTCRSTGPTAFFRRFRGRRRRRARRPRRPARYARPLEYRYSGHLENGRPSISDPGMGGLV